MEKNNSDGYNLKFQNILPGSDPSEVGEDSAAAYFPAGRDCLAVEAAGSFLRPRETSSRLRVTPLRRRWT